MSGLSDKTIDEITDAVIKQIKRQYILVEKNFDVTKHTEDNIARRIFMENIATMVCRHFKADRSVFKSGVRLKGIYTYVAVAFVKLCRVIPKNKITFNEIGLYIGKNHSTIIYLHSQFDVYFKYDLEFRLEYDRVKKYIKESLK